MATARIRLVLLISAAPLLFACEASPDADGFSEAEWAKLRTLGPLGAPAADTTNSYAENAAAASLGQKLFFDADYSGPLIVGSDGSNGGLGNAGESRKVSCASCHMASSWFSDTRSSPNATSLATDWTGRNTPPVVNSAFYDFYFWDGRKDSMWSQALGPPEATGEMNSDRLTIAHMMFAKYRAEYDAIFSPPLDAALGIDHPQASRFPASGKPKASASDPDGPWEQMAESDRVIVNRIYANFGKAIAAYERKLVSRNAPIDRYIEGDFSALDSAAKRGLKLFIGKAACDTCHSGAHLSDNKFHNIGVPQTGPKVPAVDLGREAAISQVLSDEFNSSGPYSDDVNTGRLAALPESAPERGKFRTKGLRQVAETGPYMHTGALATLRDVVEFYNLGGASSGFEGEKDPLMRPLNLTPAEVDDLVAFLGALTGEPIPASLRSGSAL